MHCSRQKYRSTRLGFTLIELLVVIAIIAILAAILFPIYLTVKSRGNSSNCASNLKQIAAALVAYQADNEGMTPAVRWVNQTNDRTDVTGWIAYYPWPEILGFKPNDKLLHCPGDQGTLPLSYDMNRFLRNYLPQCTVGKLPNGEINWATTSPRIISSDAAQGYQPPYPVRTVTFFDWRNQAVDDANGPDVPDDIETRRSGWAGYEPSKGNSAERHRGRANYAFWDGHVESLKPNQVRADSWGGGGNDVFQNGYATTMPWYKNNEPWYDPGLLNGSPAGYSYACSEARWWAGYDATAGTYPTFNIYR